MQHNAFSLINQSTNPSKHIYTAPLCRERIDAQRYLTGIRSMAAL